MKPFEYRAISKASGQWVYGYYFKAEFSVKSWGTIHYIKNFDADKERNVSKQIIPETLGVKVGDYYVGDIIEIRSRWNNVYIGIVEFGEYGQDGSGGEYGTRKCFGLYVHLIKKIDSDGEKIELYSFDYDINSSLLEWIGDKDKTIVKIGTIHDHLLKEQDNAI